MNTRRRHGLKSQHHPTVGLMTAQITLSAFGNAELRAIAKNSTRSPKSQHSEALAWLAERNSEETLTYRVTIDAVSRPSP